MGRATLGFLPAVPLTSFSICLFWEKGSLPLWSLSSHLWSNQFPHVPSTIFLGWVIPCHAILPTDASGLHHVRNNYTTCKLQCKSIMEVQQTESSIFFFDPGTPFQLQTICFYNSVSDCTCLYTLQIS